jgi:hypothetical protein
MKATSPALAPAAAALLGFALLIIQACFPLPPHLRRTPMPASVLKPHEAAGGFHGGYNVQGATPRFGRGQYQGDGLGMDGAEASMRMQSGLPYGLEWHMGMGAPDLIPFSGVRYQALGRNWAHGPFVTLEAGLNAVPDLHGGLALGAAFGPVEPYAAWRAGRFGSFDQNPYWEGAAGLAWRWKELRLSAQYGYRQHSLDGRPLAQGGTVALDFLSRVRSQGPASHEPPAQAPGSNDPCFADRPYDESSPEQWEAYAVCVERQGNAAGAATLRRYAARLRGESR